MAPAPLSTFPSYTREPIAAIIYISTYMFVNIHFNLDKCHNMVCVELYSDFISPPTILSFICVDVSHGSCCLISVSVVLHYKEFQHHSHLCCFQILTCTSPSTPYILVHIHESFSKLYTITRIAHHRLCSFSILLYTSKLLSKYFHICMSFPPLKASDCLDSI